ncbi:phenol hydrolase assembly protein [Salinisphaera sp. PC39]|uniref:phenol hydroxylase subunit n=1 Tax=Salinisphaera sp. PC39 TaxID=1304156 RepID=UPI003340D8AD
MRVTGRRAGGFVEFDFSFGDADLYIEMILPEHAFEEFCNANEVQYPSEATIARWDAEREKWREGGL